MFPGMCECGDGGGDDDNHSPTHFILLPAFPQKREGILQSRQIQEEITGNTE